MNHFERTALWITLLTKFRRTYKPRASQTI